MSHLEFGTSMYFIRCDGIRVYPVKINARSIGKYGFQLLSTDNSIAAMTHDEAEVQRLVLRDRLKVRCRPHDGSAPANGYNGQGDSDLVIVQSLL